ncbi:MAG: hypothetical protein R3361_08970, partial [Aequorivita vladivostokensis]|nr:hypothetical protein [Aequorivita vladivostokensis]
MSCGNQKYLIERIYIGTGEGAPGPPGKPGAAPDSYPADRVTVTNDGFDNAQEIFDYLLYVPVDITSFSCANGTTFEQG